MTKRIQEIGKLLAQPRIFFFSLIWLMFLLIIGTVAQKYIGLYQAQHRYFSAFFFFLGPVPVPAGYSALAVVFVNLLCKLVFASPWHWYRAGTIIAHLGALLLLLGGLLTAVQSEEGSMMVAEKETTSIVSDYHRRELVIIEQMASGKEQVLAAFPFDALQEGRMLNAPEVPFSVTPQKLCRNCAIYPRMADETQQTSLPYRGRLQDFDFTAVPLSLEDEENRAGASFLINGAGEDQDGIYMSVDFIPVSPKVMVGGKEYHVAIRKARIPLPFAIELVEFRKEVHPGTDMARSYSSHVVLHDGTVQWPAVIRMNEPLRYKGYTLYQSSFIAGGGGKTSVFAVVRNAGRMFPYISSSIMCIGLLIHLFLRMPALLKKTS